MCQNRGRLPVRFARSNWIGREKREGSPTNSSPDCRQTFHNGDYGRVARNGETTQPKRFSLPHKASEAKAAVQQERKRCMVCIVVSSSQPPFRLHLSGKTFAKLIQEGARPELGSWTLPHLSHQDRPTSARMRRSRCSLPADGPLSFLESERSKVSARATRPVRFVRELRFSA